MTGSTLPEVALRPPLLHQRPPQWMVTVRCLALMGLVGVLAPIASMLILGVYLWLMVLPVVIIVLGVPATMLQWRWLQPAVPRWRFSALLTTGLVVGALAGFGFMMVADEAYRNLYSTLLAMALMSTVMATAAQTLVLRWADRAVPTPV